MINPKQRAKIVRAVNKLVETAIENSWSGAENPEDREEIEAEHRKAKANLRKILDSLTVENGQ